jgi:hypothetical protein
VRSRAKPLWSQNPHGSDLVTPTQPPSPSSPMPAQSSSPSPSHPRCKRTPCPRLPLYPLQRTGHPLHPTRHNLHLLCLSALLYSHRSQGTHDFTASLPASSNRWYSRHSPHIHSHPHALAESELLALALTGARTTVLNLAGLWGGPRKP